MANNVIVRLFASRKFVATLVGLIGLTVTLATGHISGTIFASAATPLVIALIVSIAAEDVASKGATKFDLDQLPPPPAPEQTTLKPPALTSSVKAASTIVGAIALVVLSGCGHFRPASAPLSGFVASPDRCATLDDRATWSGGVAAGAGLLAGGSGLSTIASDDKTARLSLAIGAGVMGAIAAGAAFFGHSTAQTFISEGCGNAQVKP